MRLFPRLRFDALNGAAATSRPGEFRPLDEVIGKIPFSSKDHWKKGHYLRGVSARILRLLGKVGVLSWVAGYRYVLAPTHINLIGRLEGAPDGTERPRGRH